MTLQVFPSIPTQGWSVLRAPVFNTLKSQHVSGKVARANLAAFPLWRFTLTYDVLFSGAGTPQYLEQLRGFFESLTGQQQTFLFLDPEFNNNFNQVLGTGDGTTTDFALTRSIGAFYTEPIGQIGTLVNAYLGGVAQGSGFSVQNTPYPVLRWATPPGVGVQVMADYTSYFLVRFMNDDMTFEEFMKQMHAANQVQFQSVKP